ncbi:DUF805 domain-containing protein [Mucilaginibacter sp.]
MGKVFSFNGRIKRGEYAASFATYVVAYVILRLLLEKDPSYGILGFLVIPMIWFLWAQGAKRCHDLNKSGWWQLIPFYFFVLLFSEGDYGPNQYDIDNYVPFYGADDYEKPYDAEDLTLNSIEVPNSDCPIQ